MNQRPAIQITYCTGCKWLLRSAWMAQELLSTFQDELASVTLIPGRGGVFEIHIDDERIWSREVDGGFPDIKVLKRLVRDRACPERDLGHVDSSKEGENQEDAKQI